MDWLALAEVARINDVVSLFVQILADMKEMKLPESDKSTSRDS